MADNYLHSGITSIIIKAFFIVYNRLGHGFLEKVYQNALVIELRKLGLECMTNYPINVFYDDHHIGTYFADILVNHCVIIENKAAEALCPEHEAQLINYLKATNIEVGMLLNFGIKATFKRKVFSKEFKS
jgi:GxxExxY protein